MSRITLSVVAASFVFFTQSVAVEAQPLTPDRVVVTGPNADRNTPVAGTNFDPGPLDDGGAPIIIRERSGTPGAAENRFSGTFLDFDLSTLTPGDVNDPTFTAVFSAEHVARLNDVNSGMQGLIGRVQDDGINGDSWDLIDGQYPDYDWGLGAAADPVVFFPEGTVDVETPPVRYSAIVTDIVRDWVNGTHANNGFAIYASAVSQGAAFDNAELSFDLLLGDFDLSGTVDGTDFTTLNDNLAGELDGDVEYADGDIDFDGDIDLDDFGIFKGLFPGVVASVLGVPEPSTIGLLALACGLVGVNRSRRTLC